MIPGGNAGVGEYGSHAVRILQYHLAELLTQSTPRLTGWSGLPSI